MNFKWLRFRLKMRFWPPMVGARIRIKNVSKDLTSFDMEMKLRWWNANMHKMHFGGSLFAMADPTYSIILSNKLGPDYISLDKVSTIRFLQPGKGKVTAHFNISAERIAEIKKAADDNYKVEPKFNVDIRDEKGVVVASVEKIVYVRRKDKQPISGFKPATQP